MPPPNKAGKKKLRLAERLTTASHEGIGAASVVSSSASAADAQPPAAKKAKPAAVPAAASAAAPAAPAAATAAAAKAAGPKGRKWTVSIALPGSIVDNAQTHELRSSLVGQVARACAIFNVDEIVVFGPAEGSQQAGGSNAGLEGERSKKKTDGSIFMARLLQYVECPQYLRKHIFPVHPDLRCVGLLPPLDAPHHLRIDEPSEFREAVVVPAASGGSAGGAAAAPGADAGGPPATSNTVYTGLRKELKIGRALPTGTRVTVRMPASGGTNARAATVVPPRLPRESAGHYWGYEVRLAKGLSAVWSECPYEGGYDMVLGTSEHGTAVPDLELPPFAHLLIVFGGVEGLEPVVASEDNLAEYEDDLPSLFDHYLNLCPAQGSRTIRTEEALLVGLSALKPTIERANV